MFARLQTQFHTGLSFSETFDNQKGGLMTKDWVDFRVVKQAVSMQMVLDHYNINWLRKN